MLLRDASVREVDVQHDRQAHIEVLDDVEAAGGQYLCLVVLGSKGINDRFCVRVQRPPRYPTRPLLTGLSLILDGIHGVCILRWPCTRDGGRSRMT